MFITLDRGSGVSTKKQLYDAIISKILQGELLAGQKLPSSRELADRLEIARNTIIEIYEQLISEAYIETVNGKGTFVCQNLLSPSQEYGVKKDRSNPVTVKSNHINFISGVPDLKFFPKKEWMKAIKESLYYAEDDDLGYSHIYGYLPLRESLAEYLMKYKGIYCSSRQIIIVNGTSDAIALLALLFHEKVKQVLIESATVSFVPSIFKAYDYELCPVSIDKYGICTEQLPNSDNGLIFVSPSHQFPLGGTMPINRRHQLVTYAKEHNHYIIEDDYDSEFRYVGAPVNSLYQITSDCVVHIGTFSKTLSPSLRLGYMVLPKQLLPQIKNIFVPVTALCVMRGM